MSYEVTVSFFARGGWFHDRVTCRSPAFAVRLVGTPSTVWRKGAGGEPFDHVDPPLACIAGHPANKAARHMAASARGHDRGHCWSGIVGAGAEWGSALIGASR